MLEVINYIIFSYLLFGIIRANKTEEAVGYLLVSGLVPLPILIVGNSANAGIYIIDFALVVFLFRYGLRCISAFRTLNISYKKQILLPLTLLMAIAMLSAAVNYFFIDPLPWRFYLFASVKFVEYWLIAIIIVTTGINVDNARYYLVPLIIGMSIYHIVHVLHLTNVLPLSGYEMFGRRALEIGETIFENRASWFLTSIKACVAGTATINFWLTVGVYPIVHSRFLRILLLMTFFLSLFSLFGTNSRSDIAGLIASAVVFLALSKGISKKLKIMGIMLSISAVIVTSLIQAWFVWDESARSRMFEMVDYDQRMMGSYAGRVHDREALIDYMLTLPTEVFIGSGPGNFKRYFHERITVNEMGHNSYLHWLGELGIVGGLLVIIWCILIAKLFLKNRKKMKTDNMIDHLAIVGMALLISRMVAAWGAESLFGVDGMGYYSMYFLSILYFFLSLMAPTKKHNEINSMINTSCA